MSFWLQKKYINLISPRIPNFKWKSTNLANGRCPFCKDSLNNPRKMRFYIFIKNNQWKCFCHNCSYSNSFKGFLKQTDERLYNEFKLESLKEIVKPIEDYSHLKTNTSFRESLVSVNRLKTISQLSHDHPAKIYMLKRKIPNYWHSIFRWCPHFTKWINDFIIPGKFDENALKFEEGRIVIPFFKDKKKSILHALQGRMVEGSGQMRYIPIVINHDIPMLWGLDKINAKKLVYAFEGVFDALFFRNSLAICGSNYASLTKYVPREQLVVCYDNEPRSLETKKKISRAIDQGLKVFIFSDNVSQKDVNQMVMEGYSVEHIEWIIKNNTFEGLTAKTRLAEWSKR